MNCGGDYSAEAAFSREVASLAGEMLVALRGSRLFEGEALGRAGDRLANTLIMEALAARWPHDAVLSEEETDSPTRLCARRVWIVDPLDGTREYREGRQDWAVHVALAVDGCAVAGAVATPDRGVVLCSAAPLHRAGADAPLRMVVSRTRPPIEALAVAERLGAHLVPMGSAGAKAAAVVLGEADIYLHAGGQNEWDNCAPVAVAQAAGLHVSRLDGGPLTYNRPDPASPELLICRPELAARILADIVAVRRREEATA